MSEPKPIFEMSTEELIEEQSRALNVIGKCLQQPGVDSDHAREIFLRLNIISGALAGRLLSKERRPA